MLDRFPNISQKRNRGFNHPTSLVFVNGILGVGRNVEIEGASSADQFHQRSAAPIGIHTVQFVLFSSDMDAPPKVTVIPVMLTRDDEI